MHRNNGAIALYRTLKNAEQEKNSLSSVEKYDFIK